MQMKGRERAVPSNVRVLWSAQLRTRTRAVPKLVLVAALNAWLLIHSGLELQTKFLSRGSVRGPEPQVDCQAPSSSHNEPSLTSFADHAAIQVIDQLSTVAPIGLLLLAPLAHRFGYHHQVGHSK